MHGVSSCEGAPFYLEALTGPQFTTLSTDPSSNFITLSTSCSSGENGRLSMQAVCCRGIQQELVSGWEVWIREDLILVGMSPANREHVRSPTYVLVRCLHLHLTLGR